MNSLFFQRFLMAAYKLALRLGVLRRGPGRVAYELAYDLYKRFFEAKYIDLLAAYARPGTMVIDIGANTGFFTTRFCRWVGPQGKVLAIEPEADNVRALEHRLEKAGFTERVEIIHAAAADSDGETFLKINPDHPGDHRISGEGIPTRMVMVDGLAGALEAPSVSLVKIDVQGAETKVIEGARAMLAKHHPTLFVEIDDGALKEMGSGARQLLDLIAGFGYTMHALGKYRPSRPLSADDIMAILAERESYIDCLFLPEDNAPPSVRRNSAVGDMA